MQFAIYCTDKPASTDLRAATRADHLAFIDGYMTNLIIAGPLLSDDGETMIGSLLIMDFADLDAAKAFAAADPYAQAGLFDSVVIRPWKKALPKN